MLLLKKEDMEKVITMSMTLEALEEAQKEVSKDDAADMGRVDLYLPCVMPDSYNHWAVMTGGTKKGGFVVAGCSLIS